MKNKVFSVKKVLSMFLILALISGNVFAGSTMYRSNNPHVRQAPYDQLCWAAVTVSILYSVAGESVGFTQHVKNVYGSIINEGRYYYDIMDDFAEYGIESKHTGTLSFSSVESEVKANRPVFAIIRWNTGTNHATALSGTDRAGQYVRVMDPAERKWVHIKYTKFKDDYDGKGYWKESITF